MLALVSARVLSNAGFDLWDLGGTDSSPGMRYKASVTETFLRPAFAAHFARCRKEAVGVGGGSLTDVARPVPSLFGQGGLLRPGLVVQAHITEADLFS